MTWYNDIRQNWQRRRPGAAGPWRQAWPGLVVLSLILGGRFLGLFQGLELKMLDTFLRWRPAEPIDERVLIVGIDETDIQRMGTYPLPDADLAALLRALDRHQPRAIGIDIYRDFPVPPGSDELAATLADLPDVVGIEKILGESVSPAPALPPDQVGFIDLPIDDDGFVRRVLLGVHGADDTYRFALSLRLAQLYLDDQGIELENGRRDFTAMRFGDTELTRFQPHMGGYVRADSGSNEIFLNPRSGPAPFRTVSLREVMEGQVNPAWIEDAVVLIGITALSVKDLINSAAVVSENPGLVYGVDIHAHATSQLIHATLDGRPLLHTWPKLGEYVWIILWGSVSIVLFRWFPSQSWYGFIIGLAGLAMAGVSFLCLWLGGTWVPLVPALGAIWLSGFLYDQRLRARISQQQRGIEERQRVIKHTYNAIHNGPLQTLALLLRDAGEALDWPTALAKLRTMDQELRDIYEGLLNAAPDSDHPAPALAPLEPVDPTPLHEKLCEVYTQTLQRDFPAFATLKFNLVNFDPLNTSGLSADDRQDLCRFLEEALCNVGKHAVQPTQITINCSSTDQQNLIQVKDNGKGPTEIPHRSQSGGWGTRQAEQLARRLRGAFHRSITDRGTCCELRWPID
jgi:CHASE2 domain-containing sensor protein